MKLAKWMREAPQGCFQMYSKDEQQTFDKKETHLRWSEKSTLKTE